MRSSSRPFDERKRRRGYNEDVEDGEIIDGRTNADSSSKKHCHDVSGRLINESRTRHSRTDDSRSRHRRHSGSVERVSSRRHYKESSGHHRRSDRYDGVPSRSSRDYHLESSPHKRDADYRRRAEGNKRPHRRNESVSRNERKKESEGSKERRDPLIETCRNGVRDVSPASEVQEEFSKKRPRISTHEELEIGDQHEEDPEEFLEAARRRREAVLAKYRQKETISNSSVNPVESSSLSASSPNPQSSTVSCVRSEGSFQTSAARLDNEVLAAEEEALFLAAAADVPDDEEDDDSVSKERASEANSPRIDKISPQSSTVDVASLEVPKTISLVCRSVLYHCNVFVQALKDGLVELKQRVQEDKRRLRQFIIMQREEQDRKRHEAEDEEEEEEDDDVDMFSITDQRQNVKKKARRRPKNESAKLIDTSVNLAENWDDAEGYYMASIGEELDSGRYRVLADLSGKGVFSTVVKCYDSETHGTVAIKIIRNNEMMKRAAEKEADILERLNRSDKEDRRHVVRLQRTFEFRGHICLVFEWLWGNLRVALKKYGGTGRGLNPQAVYSYSKQLFIGLRHLKKNGVLHADLKPDNILINEKFAVLKICDLGSAFDVSENEVTSYLVSRFYRAPEIILGCRYDPAIDVWSAACTIYEIATGDVLFPGRSNNDMLKLFMDAKGRLPSKLVRAGQLSEKHFDSNQDFLWIDQDSYTKQDIVRRLADYRQTKNVTDLLLAKHPQCSGSSQKSQTLRNKVRQLGDFLDKCLVLDPAKRLTPDEALRHPYLAQPLALETHK
ncbi:serine/threonine-protein kinase PRP4 homolog [Condylostylus longicornis]|uniref:serine/threonine-protein kinase PRP4 homolog n=1 Tax=Condylostylus longicornis TaxID=2530218 RepID=UPI00244DC0B1|nr:serine/threonine-protein kinase PRP4 homolog [Condylostylus longicornis]